MIDPPLCLSDGVVIDPVDYWISGTLIVTLLSPVLNSFDWNRGRSFG